VECNEAAVNVHTAQRLAGRMCDVYCRTVNWRQQHHLGCRATSLSQHRSTGYCTHFSCLLDTWDL